MNKPQKYFSGQEIAKKAKQKTQNEEERKRKILQDEYYQLI